MRKILFAILSILSATVNAQWIDTANFEIGTQLIQIDTSQPNNIWQIGVPQKIFFDSAFSKSKAILTDTINSYPINNISSFQLVIKEPVPNTWGNNMTPFVFFWHKYETDSLLDGGYIDLSYDGGANWINVADAPEIDGTFSHNDTISGGIKAFTGNSKFSSGYPHNWSGGFLHWYTWCSLSPSQITFDSVIVRFTFKSDNIQTNKEGWMIDDISYGTMVCQLGINEGSYLENSISIFPNPSSSTLFIESQKLNIGTLQIIDAMGKGIKNVKINNQKTRIDINNFPRGIYFVRIETTEGVFTKKIIIQR